MLIAIQHSRNQLLEIKLQHVQGHQDWTTSYAHLDQMGQLNVDADAKAGEFQDAHGAYRPWVPLSSFANAHLSGPHGTITSQYSNRIRHLATTTPLRAHLLQKYQWSPMILTSINWESHGSALEKLQKNAPTSQNWYMISYRRPLKPTSLTEVTALARYARVKGKIGITFLSAHHPRQHSGARSLKLP